MFERSVLVCCVALLFSACSPSRERQLCDAIARRDVAAVQHVLSGPELDVTINRGSCVPADVFRVARPNERALNDIAVALLSAGMPPDASWIPPGAKEPMWAVEAAARNGNDTLVRGLLAVGLDARSLESTRALVQAAGAGHLGVVRLLVEGGADLAGTSAGETALERARANERADVVQFLEATAAAREAATPREAGDAERKPER